MPVAFVTATGTDIGKTFVTAALIRHLRASGGSVEAIKPVMSGYDPAMAETSDAGRLLAAMNRPVTDTNIAEISPWRFGAPISPDIAAQREGRSIDFNAVVDVCRRSYGRGTLLIEGIGGIMVPLDASHTVLDWMTALRAPVLLVAGSYLGTISHTLTALHVLAQRRLDIAAVVVSESIESGAPLDETASTIDRFAGGVPVIGLPRRADGTADETAMAQIAKAL